MEIKDSGSRREFHPAADGHIPVRDMAEGKGRFDLIPLESMTNLLDFDAFLSSMAAFHADGERAHVADALGALELELFGGDTGAMLIDLSQHFENGLKKYGQDNWRGIPAWSFYDSACRHYCKMLAGWKDENHKIACVWNVVCLLWTIDQGGKL